MRTLPKLGNGLLRCELGGVRSGVHKNVFYFYNHYNIIANLIARLRVHIIISLNQLKIYIYIFLCTLSLSGHIHRFVLICFPRFYYVSCTPVQSTEVISMSRQVMTSDPVSMAMLECGVLLKSLLSKL